MNVSTENEGVKVSLNSFEMGSLVIPARDSVFYSLSKTKAESLNHLGVILENSKNKARVLFPVENICLWLSHGELAKVQCFEPGKISENRKDYQELIVGLKSNLDSIVKKGIKNTSAVSLLVSFLTFHFEAKTFIGFEMGNSLESVWNSPQAPYLENNYQGNCFYLGLTVGELFLDKLNEILEMFSNSIIQYRIIPSSLSKIELSFFFKMGS